jgi:hypothetical protein
VQNFEFLTAVTVKMNPLEFGNVAWKILWCAKYVNNNNKDNKSVALFRERTLPTERLPFVGEVSALRIEVCRVVSATEIYGRNLGFLDRSRYFFFQLAPQLYSRGWVDPVPDALTYQKIW